MDLLAANLNIGQRFALPLSVYAIIVSLHCSLRDGSGTYGNLGKQPGTA